MGRLGLGSEPHVVGRLGSGPRVGARLSPGVFSVGGLSSRGVVSGGVISENRTLNSLLQSL